MKSILLLVLFLPIKSFHSLVHGQTTSAAYPQIKGYASFTHPIVSFDKTGSTWNFSNGYTVGFPFGLNLLKSEKIGFSFELNPTIRAENGSSKVSSFLFHPGLMFRRSNGFTFISRLAFETNGRYGFTPVFNKIVARKKDFAYFVAVPLPVRFGSDKPASVSAGLQLGITF